MKDAIRTRLLQAATAIIIGAAGGVATHQAANPPKPSAAVVLAMELGAYYESSGRHIGTPYVDKLGKGQPLTVCNGITGREVVAGRYYTREDCRRLELPRYQAAEREAARLFSHWASYNVWVRASIIDMLYNLGAPAIEDSTLLRLANAGNLDAACAQMPRWVRGTVNGQSVVLPGLQDRRATTAELCAEWGRDGHFSEGLLAQEGRP
jgi:lysozyme